MRTDLRRAGLAAAALLACCAAEAGAKEVPAKMVKGWPAEMRGVNIILRWIKEPDVAHLAADWRANSVRLMCGELIGAKPPYELNRERIAKLHTVVGWCRKNGIFTVINQQPPGWRRNPGEFYKNARMQEKYAESWVEIARHYAKEPEVVAYDLQNEPHGPGSAENWHRLAKEMTAAVRKVDTVHAIVVEPHGWGNSPAFRDFEPTGDERTVYSFHLYDPFNFTHQKSREGTLKASPELTEKMKYPGVMIPRWGLEAEMWNRERLLKEITPAIEFRTRHNVVLWCGEFGCTRWANGMTRWMTDSLDLFEANRIGWSWYSYREWHAMDLERPAGTRDRNAPRTETPAVKLFKRYLAGRGGRGKP